MGEIGLAMYLFDGNAIVVSVRAESGNKKYKYSSLLRRAIIFDLCLFIVFASICYYVYREQAQPIFTMSLVPVNGLVYFILACVSINALTSYPVQILAAFKIIENFGTFFKEPETPVSKWQRTKVFLVKLAIRALVIAVTTAVCLFVTTFTDFINISGAIGSVTVAFIIPELLYLKVFRNQMSKVQIAGCIALALFGIGGCTYSLIYSLRKILG